METLEHWQIDAGHSSFRFSLRHLVVHEIRGSFSRWGGQLILDRDDPLRSKVAVWIDLASIDTGEPERDAQVRSAELLNVDRFPKAEFHSKRITVRDHEPATLTGRLNLHGVSHDVDLVVESQRSWTDPDGRLRAVYTIAGKVNRQAFGLRWNQDLDAGGVVVGDQVLLQVEASLVRAPLRPGSFDEPPADTWPAATER